jgi:Holliday junction resolvasome RuvABC endonuclease subunit
MLNTSLSDTERYPLKVRDLIVMDSAVDRAPMKIEWMPDPKRELKALPNLAMASDRFYQFAAHSDTFADYTGSVMSIDPSGRGKDETGYAVVKMLNGYLHVRRCGGLPGGYENATLEQLARIAKDEKVNHVIIEANFGDGMYTELIKPILAKSHPCIVEEVKHSTQKERRIIDTLEPVLNRHRLVFDRMVIEDDYRTAQAYEADNKYTKSLIYQMTRISYDKGSLKHDDRLDALAIAVAYWTERMAQDADKGVANEREKLLDKELEDFMANAIGRSKRSPSLISFQGR